MAAEQLFLVCSGALTLLTLALSLWLLLVSTRQRKELQSHKQQILALTALVDSAGKPAAQSPGEGSFSAQLADEERYQLPKGREARNPAEKYTYVAAMARQGMDAGQIAAALQLAPAEVTQLLRLASLQQGH